jgi:hypothetical protein
MDNPFGVIEKLNEVEQAEFDALDNTPPPEALLKELRKHASVGWVRKYVATHSRWCPAQRMLRRLGVAALVLTGAVLALNIFGALSAKAMFKEAVRDGVRAEMKEAIKQEVKDALKELGLINTQLLDLQNRKLAQVADK